MADGKNLNLEVCIVCGFIYDEAKGLPEDGIAHSFERWRQESVHDNGSGVRGPGALRQGAGRIHSEAAQEVGSGRHRHRDDLGARLQDFG